MMAYKIVLCTGKMWVFLCMYMTCYTYCCSVTDLWIYGMYVCMYVCIYVCMYVYMYVCMYVCMCMYVCVYICMYVYVCMYVYMYACVCMYVCMYACVCMYVLYMYVCMYVCMFVLCMFVCMFACIYVCLYVFCFYVRTMYVKLLKSKRKNKPFLQLLGTLILPFNKILFNSAIQFNLLKTKHNLLYIRNQSVPRSKHFSPRL